MSELYPPWFRRLVTRIPFNRRLANQSVQRCAMTQRLAKTVFAFILVYLPLCAVAEAQTMSTQEAEAYLAELYRQATPGQRPESTKVLEWNSEVQVLAWRS
jgi:hypothetical protein